MRSAKTIATADDSASGKIQRFLRTLRSEAYPKFIGSFFRPQSRVSHISAHATLYVPHPLVEPRFRPTSMKLTSATFLNKRKPCERYTHTPGNRFFQHGATFPQSHCVVETVALCHRSYSVHRGSSDLTLYASTLSIPVHCTAIFSTIASAYTNDSTDSSRATRFLLVYCRIWYT